MDMAPTPRIAPLAPEEWTAAQRDRFQPLYEEGRRYNIAATLARHEKAYPRFREWTHHFMDEGSCRLSVRDREMVILRTTWLCRAPYAWAQHVEIALAADVLTSADLERLRQDVGGAGWSESESTLLRAVDELHQDRVVSDTTWHGLALHFDIQQLMDIVFAAGHYTAVSMATRSFGLQLDRGLTSAWK